VGEDDILFEVKNGKEIEKLEDDADPVSPIKG
jgi:hypothetical protein